MGRLNDARIRSEKPAAADKWIGDGGGLWLRVRTGGAKVFVLRSLVGGKAKVITLGQWPGVTLQAARLEAAKRADQRARGVLRPELPAVSVAALADEYFNRRIRGRYKRIGGAQVYRDRLVEALGTRRASEVRALDVASIVKGYAAAAPVAANRFLSFVKQVFTYGIQTGVLESSPVATLTAAVAGGEEKSRSRVLTDAELKLLWHADSEHAPLVRLLLLTGVRIGEAQLATWQHFDLKARRWTIPAAHAKNKRAHWVHLTDAALAVLGSPREPHARALRSVSLTAVQAWMARWCQRQGITERFTPHDLRRTFVSRLGDLGVAPHTIRRLINHVEPGSLSVYLRSEFAPERCEATERWAAELLRIVG